MRIVFGVFLIIGAMAAFLFGAINLIETSEERSSRVRVSASRDHYEGQKEVDILSRALGDNDTSHSDSIRDRMNMYKDDLSDSAGARQTRMFLGFGIGGVFLISGILCFVVGGSSPTPTHSAFIPPPIPPPIQEKTFRVAKNGNDLGEMSVGQIKSLLLSKELSFSDYFFDPHTNEWNHLFKCSEIVQ